MEGAAIAHLLGAPLAGVILAAVVGLFSVFQLDEDDGATWFSGLGGAIIGAVASSQILQTPRWGVALGAVIGLVFFLFVASYFDEWFYSLALSMSALGVSLVLLKDATSLWLVRVLLGVGGFFLVCGIVVMQYGWDGLLKIMMFRTKWKHPDPANRRYWVENQLRSQKTLTKIARTDKDKSVRNAAKGRARELAQIVYSGRFAREARELDKKCSHEGYEYERSESCSSCGGTVLACHCRKCGYKWESHQCT